MNRKEIAAALDEIADLVELRGADPFRSRTYRRAVRIVEQTDADLAELAREGRLTELKGIGESLARTIGALAADEPVAVLDDLRAAVPAGVVELLRIPGLGPKRASVVWRDLGVTSPGELEYACRENRLVELPGFGAKSQAKILEGLGRLRRYADRFLVRDARPAAESVACALAGVDGVERVEIAGSLRRASETVHDIDLVAAAADPEALMDAFAALDAVGEVVAHGRTKTTATLSGGINADLRVVSAEEFPFAWQYLTGGKDHNVALRAIAAKSGWKLNEYGLWSEHDERIACADEAEIYDRLGLAWIPPELREDAGEIDAAVARDLPGLVARDDLAGVLHVHTTWSDGVDSVEAMASAARDRGYRYIGISDHSRSSVYAHGLEVERLRAQRNEIEDLRGRMDGIRILWGIECDILADGVLDYDDDVLAGFDFVIAAVHSRFSLDEEAQTERILRALDHPAVDILAHPTGRLLLAREGYPLDLDAVLDRAAERGVAIELNANPHRLDLDWRWCRRARERGVKISVNPDAHSAAGLDDVDCGVGIARKGWLTSDDVLNTAEFKPDRGKR